MYLLMHALKLVGSPGQPASYISRTCGKYVYHHIAVCVQNTTECLPRCGKLLAAVSYALIETATNKLVNWYLSDKSKQV